jgi:Protein of unknown function (DUF1566)
MMMKINQVMIAVLLLASSWVYADAPFTLSTDLQEVSDTKTGLIWRRCVEGMAVSGSACSGTASTFTYEQALAHARAQADATRIKWRLPNVKELYGITDASRRPTIDAVAFPGTPANFFWSSTPNLNPFRALYPNGSAYVVSFFNGTSSDAGRSHVTSVYHLRLVRNP